MSKQVPKINMHERLKKQEFQHALISTFTFGSQFFERYALEEFKALRSNGNVTVFLDRGEYEEILRDPEADREWFPKQANIRYLLYPVTVPGVFHPKVFLFAGKKRGLLFIGSANFTQAGLSSNAELVAAFDFEEEKNETALRLFQEAFDFFRQLAERWPSREVASNIDEMVREVPWLSKEPAPEGRGELPVLLTNLERPLWEQLVERLPEPLTEMSLVSRFFDKFPGILDLTFGKLNGKRLSIFTQAKTNTLGEKWLEHPMVKNGEVVMNLCRYEADGIFQPLHGKAYAFRCGKQIVFGFGSANFSSPALLRKAKEGNVEVLLCYPAIKASQFKEAEFFDPLDSAIILKKKSQLSPPSEDPDDPVHRAGNYPLILNEAWLDKAQLQAEWSGETNGEEISIRITQANARSIFMKCPAASKGRFDVVLDHSLAKRLSESASILQVGRNHDTDWVPLSNPVLIASLRELTTGRDLRTERRNKEARETPERFMQIFFGLGDDDEKQKQFLTYFDIQFEQHVRLIRMRVSNSLARVTYDGLRDLGARNLKHFEALHDAVIDFAQRHRRRLIQHIERGTAKGIPNFLHILLTVEKLLISQIDRVIFALEAESKTEMRAERWHQIRSNLDDYYRELERLLQLTAVDYLDAIMEAAPREKVIPQFEESLPEIQNIYERALAGRDSLDRLRQERLAINNPNGNVSHGPGFFKSVLSEEKWCVFLRDVRGLQTHLNERLAG